MKRISMLLFCGLAALFLAESGALRQAALQGLSLCAHSAIPALFPFMVVSSLLISLGFGQWLSPYLAGLMTPLFRLPGSASSALVLGIVGGYPIGAKTTAQLHAEGLLTREEAERLLTFCNNSGPVFLISVLGQGVFGSFRAGLYLWLIHILAALLTGLLFRGTDTAPRRRNPLPAICCKTVSLPSAFVSAVKDASLSMVPICGFILFFYILSRPLAALPAPFGAAAVGMTELFSLTPLLTPTRAGFVLSSACTAWGGLSVLCQSAAALEGSGLSLRPLVSGKALQGLLAGVLAFLVWPLL